MYDYGHIYNFCQLPNQLTNPLYDTSRATYMLIMTPGLISTQPIHLPQFLMGYFRKSTCNARYEATPVKQRPLITPNPIKYLGASVLGKRYAP